MACSSTANTWRAASRSELVRELGVTLDVEEAHELFLGKTVDGVLDAIAARAGKRPSTAWVYNWAFATAHAFLRELKSVDGVGVAVETLRRRGHPMAVASQSPLARVQLSLQVAGLAGQFGDHIYVTTMVARPKPAPDIYLLAAAEARCRARELHRHRRLSGRVRPPRSAPACASSATRPARLSMRCVPAAPRSSVQWTS